MHGYQRINVCGGYGTGKSVVAKVLGEKLGMKRIHIDDLYWLENWGEIDRDQLKDVIHTLISRKKWLIDGNYSWLLEIIESTCDLIIILRPPLIINLWRLWWRCFFRRFNRLLVNVSRPPINLINANPRFGLFHSFNDLGTPAIRYYKYAARHKYLVAKRKGITVYVVTSSNPERS
ncbi:MAG: hypothetical protein IH840_01105 [Candidatus Heimdallarchaeota archaeon]|nr:hypothetical protein [Candidatus Heimdallarchaeota archaeon]